MGSGAMIYIPSCLKFGSGIQKWIGWNSQTHRQHGDLISLLLCFQHKESRLKYIKYTAGSYNVFKCFK
jgi:hypothetical protein